MSIGHLVRACEQARRDARHGVKRSWREFPSNLDRLIYFEAWHRETDAMAKRGQLAQCEMPLDVGHNAVAVTDSPV